MLIESDDVYAIYDGPCNQTECIDAPVSSNCSLLVVCAHDLFNETNCLYLLQVCGTDFVTYPSICVLRTQSSNVRADYEGNLYKLVLDS